MLTAKVISTSTDAVGRSGRDCRRSHSFIVACGFEFDRVWCLHPIRGYSLAVDSEGAANRAHEGMTCPSDTASERAVLC